MKQLLVAIGFLVLVAASVPTDAPDARGTLPAATGNDQGTASQEPTRWPALVPQVTGEFEGGGDPILVYQESRAVGLACCFPGAWVVMFDNGDVLWGASSVAGDCAATPAVSEALEKAGLTACPAQSGNFGASVARAIGAWIATSPQDYDEICMDCGYLHLTSLVGDGWTTTFQGFSQWTNGTLRMVDVCAIEHDDLSMCQAWSAVSPFITRQSHLSIPDTTLRL